MGLLSREHKKIGSPPLQRHEPKTLRVQHLNNTRLTVELWAAKIPGLVGLLADHFWFIVRSSQSEDRWEVWQLPNVRGKSWGHLHQNIMSPEQGVGGGRKASTPARKIKSWIGEEAERLSCKILEAPTCYPYTENYRYWPGPNSNTYAQWVLDAIGYELMPTAIGKDYSGWYRFQCRDAYELTTPIFSIKFRQNFVQIKLLLFFFMVDVANKKMSVPFKRDA